MKMSKKAKWWVGLDLMVLCYAMLCWPGDRLCHKYFIFSNIFSTCTNFE